MKYGTIVKLENDQGYHILEVIKDIRKHERTFIKVLKLSDYCLIHKIHSYHPNAWKSPTVTEGSRWYFNLTDSEGEGSTCTTLTEEEIFLELI